jgi:hypothetical protein
MSDHVIKMFGYGTRLLTLGFPIPPELSTDLVLASLPPSYNGFIMNYNMNGMEKMPNELLAMLKSTEASMKRDNNQIMMVTQTTNFKKKRARGPKEPRNSRCLVQSLRILNASLARGNVTGRGTVRSSWKKGRRPASPEKV